MSLSFWASALTFAGSSTRRQTWGGRAPGKFHSVSQTAGPVLKDWHSISASALTTLVPMPLWTSAVPLYWPMREVPVWERIILAMASSQ